MQGSHRTAANMGIKRAPFLPQQWCGLILPHPRGRFPKGQGERQGSERLVTASGQGRGQFWRRAIWCLCCSASGEWNEPWSRRGNGIAVGYPMRVRAATLSTCWPTPRVSPVSVRDYLCRGQRGRRQGASRGHPVGRASGRQKRHLCRGGSVRGFRRGSTGPGGQGRHRESGRWKSPGPFPSTLGVFHHL